MFSANFEHTENEFEPILSSETIKYHYGKHHAGYANMLNSLIQNTPFQTMTLEEIIVSSRGKNPKVFNNASQLFNHDFYWKCISGTKTQPHGKLAELINSKFGDFDDFRQQYIGYANTMFGSGWSWLILENNELKFLNTSNAENPLGTQAIPLCVIDLWEHAYYIDYRNARADYIKNVVMNSINWKFCELQMERD